MKIEYLEIYTSAIKEQLNFYRDVLGFSITKNSENNFRFSAGFTEICFQFKKDAKPYHIAFHLPAHQEDLALNWLKERVVIEKNDTEHIPLSGTREGSEQQLVKRLINAPCIPKYYAH